MTTLSFFGLDFNAVPLSIAAEQIINAAGDGQKGLVVTPNVDHIVMLETDIEMRHIFQKAMFCYPDGMPLVWLSRLTKGVSFPERVTGADLLPAVCKIAAQHGKRVFFLGGQQGAAVMAARNMSDEFAGLQVAGTYCPPMGFEHNQTERIKIIDLINKAKVDIIFLGVGTPKQEKWAWKNIQQLHVGPILCVGAALDFAAGITKRAPDLIQRTGLEWLWRLCKEPRRLWKRYLLRDSRFLGIALREIYISYFQHRSE